MASKKMSTDVGIFVAGNKELVCPKDGTVDKINAVDVSAALLIMITQLVKSEQFYVINVI